MAKTQHSDEPIPDLDLELLHLDELPEDHAAALRAQIQRDEALRRRFQQLAHSDAAIFASYPPQQVTAELRRRLQKPAGRPAAPSAWLRWLALPSLAAAALLLLWPRAPQPQAESAPLAAHGGVRAKGLRPFLRVDRKTSDGSEALEDGDAVRPGDRLQIGYVAAGYRYGAIFSVDGRGAISRHLPRRGQQATPLHPQGEAQLSFSYQLDDAPSFERFFFITSQAPFDADVVRLALQQRVREGDADRAALALPPSLVQTSLRLNKRRQ